MLVAEHLSRALRVSLLYAHRDPDRDRDCDTRRKHLAATLVSLAHSVDPLQTIFRIISDTMSDRQLPVRKNPMLEEDRAPNRKDATHSCLLAHIH